MTNKRKPGRPKIQIELRNIPMRIHCRPSEYAAYMQEAVRRGITLSELVRELLAEHLRNKFDTNN